MRSLTGVISVAQRVKRVGCDLLKTALLFPCKELLALLVCGAMAAHGLAQDSCLIGEDHSMALVGSPQSRQVISGASPGAVSRLISTLRNETDGIHIRPLYTGEIFTNTRGGLSTNDATRYQALFDLAFELDFDEMGAALPGKFFMLTQNTHGRGITEDFVGDAQFISNIDSSKNIMQMSEYWWEFGLLDDNVTVRLGKQDVNSEFFFIDRATDFIQSTFGLSPSTAFPTYPDPSVAAVVLLQLDDAWQLKTGVWDAFSSGGNWGISGNDSVLVIGELEYSYALAEGTLPGLLAVGAVYESAGESFGEPISAVHEYIFQLEQHLFRECPCDGDDMQGLAAFAGYYPRFPGSLITNDSVGDTFVAGLIYTGLLPCRDADVIGTGVVRTELFRGGTNQETVVELFYKTQLTPRLMIQPDLQYIASPSGIYRDALAVGLRFELAL